MESLLTRPDGCELFYAIDDFTDPWREAETVLFLHGLAESTEALRAAGALPDLCAQAALEFIRAQQ